MYTGSSLNYANTSDFDKLHLDTSTLMKRARFRASAAMPDENQTLRYVARAHVKPRERTNAHSAIVDWHSQFRKRVRLK